jgi:hypothetical protein
MSRAKSNTSPSLLRRGTATTISEIVGAIRSPEVRRQEVLKNALKSELDTSKMLQLQRNEFMWMMNQLRLQCQPGGEGSTLKKLVVINKFLSDDVAILLSEILMQPSCSIESLKIYGAEVILSLL